MEPVVLAGLPEGAAGDGHRVGHLAVVAVHQLGEVHHLGHLAGGGIQGDHHVHDGVLLGVVDQGQNGAVGPPVDVVVELILAQIIHPDGLSQGTHEGDLAAADAGVEPAVGVEEAVGVEALQHHLIAQNAVVVEEEGIAVIVTQAHGVVEPVGEGRRAVPVAGVQLVGVAGDGLRHVDGEGNGLLNPAPLSQGLQGDLIGLAGNQADEQEAVVPAERIAVRRALGHGGVVRQLSAGGVDGIADLAAPLGLEGQQQTVTPGAEGIQNRQGGVHGGALSDHLHQLLAQALLHVLVVVCKAVLLILVGDDPGDGDGGLHRGVVDRHGPLLAGVLMLAHLHIPVIPAAHLRVHHDPDDDLKHHHCAHHADGGDDQPLQDFPLVHRQHILLKGFARK